VFPALAELTRGGKTRLKIRIYKYPRTSTARLLCNFIKDYPKETARFSGPGLAQPVIVIYDNDEEGQKIRKVIRNVSKVNTTGAEPFVHVYKNLYVVPIPLQDGVSSSKIEDCFDSRIKETVIEGKSFHEGNSSDIHNHYGKKVFAHKVIRPNADKVDFSGFRPLLQNIGHAIAAHGKSLCVDAPVPKGSPEPR